MMSTVLWAQAEPVVAGLLGGVAIGVAVMEALGWTSRKRIRRQVVDEIAGEIHADFACYADQRLLDAVLRRAAR